MFFAESLAALCRSSELGCPARLDTEGGGKQADVAREPAPTMGCILQGGADLDQLKGESGYCINAMIMYFFQGIN